MCMCLNWFPLIYHAHFDLVTFHEGGQVSGMLIKVVFLLLLL